MCIEWSIKLGENRWDRDILNITQTKQVKKIPKLKMKDAYDLIAVMKNFLDLTGKLKLGLDRWSFLIEPKTKELESYQLYVKGYRKVKLLSRHRSLDHINENTQNKMMMIRLTANLEDIPQTHHLGVGKTIVESIAKQEGLYLENDDTLSFKKGVATFFLKPPSLVKRNHIIARKKVLSP